MNKRSRLLTALGVIALGASGAPVVTHAQDVEDDYQKVCDWLSEQSIEDLQDFIRRNPGSECLEVAAQLLAERTQPEAGVRAPSASGRY